VENERRGTRSAVSLAVPAVIEMFSPLHEDNLVIQSIEKARPFKMLSERF
jgi:hypothetical protein